MQTGTFFAELRRRKVIRVAVAYSIAAWLAVQVAETVFDPLRLPDWSLTLIVLLAILGFPVAVALAWAFELTPGGVRRDAEVTAENDAPAAESAASAPDPAPPEASVAVLPFVDISPDQDQAYFCDGVAEEILNGLVHLRGLSVASRTASFQFRGFAGDISEIARRLNVASVLEGSVRKSGDRLRVTAQLVAADSGYHLWSERYDVDAADVFAVQEKIAANIAQALRVSLNPEERHLMTRGQTRSAEAYDYYLRGLSYFHSFSWRTMEYAHQMFLRATEIDPEFGRAWAGLAYAAGYIYMYRQADEKYRQEALAASARALECCDTVESRTARGVALGLTKDYPAAEAEFDKALALNPDDYEALYLYGRLAQEQGDFRKASALWERATAVNGNDYQAALLLPQTFLAMDQPAKAREWQERGLARALRHLELYPDDARALYLSAVTHAELGDYERARRAAERALELEPDDGVVLYNLACMYAMMGRADDAMDLLERTKIEGMAHLGWLEHDATLSSLAGHPRFEALIAQLRRDQA